MSVCKYYDWSHKCVGRYFKKCPGPSGLLQALFFFLFENNIAEDSVSAVFSGHRIIRMYNWPHCRSTYFVLNYIVGTVELQIYATYIIP